MRKKRNLANSTSNADPYRDEVDLELIDLDHEETGRKSLNQENPGQVLVNFQLIGSANYLSWKNSMIGALTAKDKLQYISEDQEDYEEGTSGFRRWKKYDCLVTSWILNSVSKDLVEAFTYVTSSSEL